MRKIEEKRNEYLTYILVTRLTNLHKLNSEAFMNIFYGNIYTY